MMEFQGWD